MYIAKIVITLRPSILDPQGKAVHHALDSLGLKEVRDVRIGKFIELRIDTTSESSARSAAEQACKQLLGNPVMEDYSFTLEKQ